MREKGKAALLTARIMGHYIGDRLGPAKRTALLGKCRRPPAALTPEWLTAALCAERVLKQLLHSGTHGFVGSGSPLVEAHQRCLMFSGGGGDQGVIGWPTENLTSRQGCEQLLVASLRQSEERLRESLGEEGVHNRWLRPVRWRQTG